MAQIKIDLSWNGGSESIITNMNESDCYKAIAEKMVTLSIPNTLYVSTPVGCAEYTLKQRGSYIKGGVTYPSLYVVEDFNNIRLDKCYTYPESYLTCINAESNNYKCATRSATIPLGKKQQLSA